MRQEKDDGSKVADCFSLFQFICLSYVYFFSICFGTPIVEAVVQRYFFEKVFFKIL